jgi:hypothetical protein
MPRLIRVFSRTVMSTECEVCGVRFDLVAGGGCMRCRKSLCAQHLHGSWFQRLRVDFGAQPICCACRGLA